jgi:hypothetical protein
VRLTTEQLIELIHLSEEKLDDCYVREEVDGHELELCAELAERLNAFFNPQALN